MNDKIISLPEFLTQNIYVKHIILIISTLVFVTILSFLARKALDFAIRKNSTQINADPTNFIFLKNSISFILYGFGLFWVFQKIPFFNSLGTALFAGAGVLAAIIGFASQAAFSNIIGGLFILVFKPFRVGDAIEISNTVIGVVEEITLRHTIIKDYEFRRVIIPNSKISDETIINSSITDKRIRRHIDIGVSYDADLDKAITEIEKHPLTIDNRTKPAKENKAAIVEVKLVELGDYAVTLRAFVWSKNFEIGMFYVL